MFHTNVSREKVVKIFQYPLYVALQFHIYFDSAQTVKELVSPNKRGIPLFPVIQITGNSGL